MSKIVVKVNGEWTDDPGALSASLAAMAAKEELQAKLIAALEAEIARLREERRWVPVGERLPEDEECVEAAGPWGEDIAWWDGEQWLDALGEAFDELVTHWRKRTPGPEGVS